MLPARARLRRSRDFVATVRRSPCTFRYAGTRLVAFLDASTPAHMRSGDSPEAPALVGIVVSKAVGGAVMRNRVKRRLRAIAAHQYGSLPPGSRLVLQAKPAAAGATADLLAEDVHVALRHVLAKVRT